ncbi:MAG: hypothetical protein AAFP98_08570 [Pseudomonadota bacterium]
MPEPDPSLATRRTEMIALILSIGWLIFVAAFFLFVPVNMGDEGFEPLRFIMVFLAIFLPVVIIWIASLTARSATLMRAETRQLQAEIATLSEEISRSKQNAPLSPEASVERKLSKIAQAGKKPDGAVTTFRTKRETIGLPSHALQTQSTLALDPKPEEATEPLPRVDLIRALNFPDSEADSIGFVAMRKALNDPSSRLLVQASKDVLSLLSQDGIYMDDLTPDRSRPELWRRFAQGERGRAIGGLGGVRDRTSLALTAARMREDPIFRDACHHFLRHFDKMLISFEVVASDAEIVELAETRTARAFMLLGRVTGAFD